MVLFGNASGTPEQIDAFPEANPKQTALKPEESVFPILLIDRVKMLIRP